MENNLVLALVTETAKRMAVILSVGCFRVSAYLISKVFSNQHLT